MKKHWKALSITGVITLGLLVGTSTTFALGSISTNVNSGTKIDVNTAIGDSIDLNSNVETSVQIDSETSVEGQSTNEHDASSESSTNASVESSSNVGSNASSSSGSQTSNSVDSHIHGNVNTNTPSEVIEKKYEKVVIYDENEKDCIEVSVDQTEQVKNEATIIASIQSFFAAINPFFQVQHELHSNIENELGFEAELMQAIVNCNKESTMENQVDAVVEVETVPVEVIKLEATTDAVVELKALADDTNEVHVETETSGNVFINFVKSIFGNHGE